MVTICKTFDFDAAHFLPFLPDAHKCRHMHGHTYRVDLFLRGTWKGGTRPWVIDYSDIASAWNPIHALVDHKVLNDIPGLEAPTTERLACSFLRWLKPSLPQLVSVRVHESSTTWAQADAPDDADDVLPLSDQQIAVGAAQ